MPWLKNGPGFALPHEHVLGLVYLGSNVMAAATIRVVGYHYPLVGLLYLVQCSTLSEETTVSYFQHLNETQKTTVHHFSRTGFQRHYQDTG